jgi:antitoxin (DNA-binding transcriptional repressor) of toxin-antitoxin stability system
MSETTITATRLRQNLGEVLDSVLAGRTVHVIRNGRALCTIKPPQADTLATVEPPTKEQDS